MNGKSQPVHDGMPPWSQHPHSVRQWVEDCLAYWEIELSVLVTTEKY